MKDKSFGDEMKLVETLGSRYHRMPEGKPVLIRLDGRSFSTFTHSLAKPFDMRFTNLMFETAKFLTRTTNACIGYVASDEITLVLHSDKPDSQVFFDGRRDKINSILAAQCSVFFNEELATFIPEKYLVEGMRNQDAMPVFDCRTFSVESKQQACDVLRWREKDCTRNSIQMVGRANFSHRDLLNTNTKTIKAMLLEKRGISWDKFNPMVKRGSYIQRNITERPFTHEEISLLPLKHEARSNPDLLIKRRGYDNILMPPLKQVKNLEDVVFKGVKPLIGDSNESK